MKSPFDLEGRNILLTGASGYLGRAMAEAILSAGADLIITGRDEGQIRALQHIWQSTGRCHVMAGELSSIENVTALCKQISEEFPLLHGVVNNAYAGRVGELETIESTDFISACQYNLVVPFSLVRMLLPVLQQAGASAEGGASIVNVASMYGTVSPYPEVYGESGKNNPIHYGATKAGLIQLTRYLACHLGKKGIRANCVSPGPFPNPASDPGIPDFYDKLSGKVPMGRVGRAEEVANPVVFLLSSAASYINGANIPIDGGWTAW